jgi:hypothetical protein
VSPRGIPERPKAHADALLKRYGLHPGSDQNDAQGLEALHDYFDEKRARFAGGNEGIYREAHPTDYLSPVEATARRRLYATQGETLSDLLEVYLRAHDPSVYAKCPACESTMEWPGCTLPTA